MMKTQAGGTGKNKRRIGWLLAVLIAMGAASQPARQIRDLPANISLTEGNSLVFGLSLPVEAQADGQAIDVLGTAESVERLGSRGVSISGQEEGSANVTLRLMGILPVKTINVSVAEEKMLIPGGQLIGVAIETQGVLLVGTSDVGTKASPARAAGLRSGDSILKIDGTVIENADDLAAKVSASGGKRMLLTVERGGTVFTEEVIPLRDDRDGMWRLGAWVRDSTAGIGTLSFIDPDTGKYGALGHSVSDIDTQTRLLLSEGEIYEGAVADIRKGEEGAPGELIGSFFEEARLLGGIDKNTDLGIYGSYSAAISGEPVPVMTRSEVQEGPAVIISQIDGGGPREYACEITRVNRQDETSQRGLTLRVTDPELLAKTGGIVQGMSGSPIIQDGKLVGAVTHVLVNDPTRGYGIFIENMLEAAG